LPDEFAYTLRRDETMEQKYILAIDRGQSNIKAALCNEKAEIVCLTSEQCQKIQSPKTGWAEQDMDLMWEQAARAVKGLIQKSGISAIQIHAVAFSGQGGGNFLVDENGNSVRAGILSLDNRYEEVLHFISARNPKALPKTILTMRWLKEHEPEHYKKTVYILGSKDWIRYKMTGRVNADMSDTPAPVEEGTKEYAVECCKIAGVEECISMLPELKYGNECCGAVSQEASLECGLAEGTPVFTGAHDMIACAVGAGGIRQGHLTIIMGTLGINIAAVDRNTKLPDCDIPGDWFTFEGISQGERFVTSSIGSAGAVLDWFVDSFFCEELAAKGRRVLFSDIEKELKSCKPSDLIFHPYLMGTFYDSSLKGNFIGISAEMTKYDFLFAVYQGICIAMCLEVEKLESLLGRFMAVHFVGGGSDSRVWGQMFADILNRKIYICQEKEVGCRGAAVCAGLGFGIYSKSEEIPRPSVRHTYYPREDMHKLYKRPYELFVKTKGNK